MIAEFANEIATPYLALAGGEVREYAGHRGPERQRVVSEIFRNEF